MKLINGDSLEILKTIEDNSIDSIVTDPPYELGFMGKKWDCSGIAYNVNLWRECLRVLKPGAHLIAFGGTRTYHRMACTIEDAGFEIRDMIEWVYGSGFPKSLNIGKSVNQLETSEWSKIGKALDNIENKSIMEVWKSNSNNVKIVETQSLKNQTIAGQDMPSENFVVLNVVQNSSQENSNLLVSFAEQNLSEAQAINTKTNTALPSVEVEIRQLQDNVNFAEKQLQNQNHKSWNIFTAQCNVKEWLSENTDVNHKVDEALKTLRGNKKYSNEEITNVLYVALTDILKLTILNQSKTFQNLDTIQQMECVYAINVIITEYTAENLISNTVAILKSKAVDKLRGNEREVINSKSSDDIRGGNMMNQETKRITTFTTKGNSEWEGWGTALKPAHEPICMARKPLSEKTVVENCIKWNTGGINIDGCRVALNSEKQPTGSGRAQYWGFVGKGGNETNTLGRFPANLIHDGSDEVRECFPETGNVKGRHAQYSESDFVGDGGWKSAGVGQRTYDGSGNASRFFKSIIYTPKASKFERNKGCENLEKKIIGMSNGAQNHGKEYDKCQIIGLNVSKPIQNYHPTVKPVALMSYLCKLVTPTNGTVLDPFMGSGSTGIACKLEGFDFIGIEKEEDYCKIAQARIDGWEIEEEKLF